MCLILNIDSSMETASVCLSKNGEMKAMLKNPAQKEHAAWLHVAIRQLMEMEQLTFADLQAIAITEGPGSYTGLRVSMSAAKGLCYALQIPLVTESTLLVMTLAATTEASIPDDVLFCPMIDARRMEVFTAIYNRKMEAIVLPKALILEKNSFDDILPWHKICFFGNGSIKWKNFHSHTNSFFSDISANAEWLGKLSFRKFLNHEFTDIIYSHPAYIKEFHSHNKK